MGATTVWHIGHYDDGIFMNSSTLIRLPPHRIAGRVQVRAAATESTASTTTTGVTVEYQRQRAKAMTKYFNDAKAEQVAMNNKTLGWTAKNEIGNGRWVMTGLAIGMLTEFATGLNFVDQIKYTLTVMGVADIYE